jgi:lipoprotein-releasing system ATP-binding protein
MTLSVTAVRKSYPDLQVLDGLELSIGDGEIVAIRGASGTGKSTLLHCLGLLDRVDSGSITLGGTELTTLGNDDRATTRARRIGFVFQAFNLLGEFDVLENVLMSARTAGADLAAATTRARALLASVGMTERAHYAVGKLSGGERQRVALCRALLNKPELLLADEPTGNLDPVTAATVIDQMVTLAREHGSSVVMVTHDPDIAARADRILDLRGGKLHGAKGTS